VAIKLLINKSRVASKPGATRGVINASYKQDKTYISIIYFIAIAYAAIALLPAIPTTTLS
jgi:hypothetical protein